MEGPNWGGVPLVDTRQVLSQASPVRGKSQPGHGSRVVVGKEDLFLICGSRGLSTVLHHPAPVSRHFF